MYIIIGRHLIHLVQTFQLNTIVLCNRVHTFTAFYTVWTFLICFICFLLFFLQPYHLVQCQWTFSVSLIIFCKFLVTDTDLLCNTLIGISLSCLKVIFLIIYMYRMQLITSCWLINCRVMCHELIITLGLIIFI